MEELTHEQLVVLKEKAKAKKEEQYLLDSKTRLDNIATKKIQTAFIGALDVFESIFGNLWGHNQKHLTEKQLEMRDEWEKARNKILTNGNNQIRALNTELEMYTVRWNRYITKIPFIGDK